MPDIGELVRKITSHSSWGFLTAIVVALVTSVFSFVNISTLENNLQLMYEQEFKGQNIIQTAQIRLYLIEKEIKNLYLVGDQAEIDESISKILTFRTDISRQLGRAKPLFNTQSGKDQFAFAGRVFRECSALMDNAIKDYKAQKLEATASVVLEEINSKFEVLDNILEKLNQMKQKSDLRIYQEIKTQLELSLAVILLTLLATIATKIVVYRRKRSEPGCP
jgi:methyl-accepting chemotaxis protein